MESMTQSAQISSSQGFADGQNSAAKESKLSGKASRADTLASCYFQLPCSLRLNSPKLRLSGHDII